MYIKFYTITFIRELIGINDMQCSNLFPQSTAQIGFKKAMSDNWITTDHEGTGENKMVFRKVKKKKNVHVI